MYITETIYDYLYGGLSLQAAMKRLMLTHIGKEFIHADDYKPHL